jgi:hypothetical protein
MEGNLGCLFVIAIAVGRLAVRNRSFAERQSDLIKLDCTGIGLVAEALPLT